jgi:hypothetical protein
MLMLTKGVTAIAPATHRRLSSGSTLLARQYVFASGGASGESSPVAVTWTPSGNFRCIIPRAMMLITLVTIAPMTKQSFVLTAFLVDWSRWRFVRSVCCSIIQPADKSVFVRT